MKIAFNKKNIKGPWGGGNQILLLLCNYLKAKGHNICFDLNCNPDIVIMMDIKDSSCSFSIKQLEQFKNRTGVKVIHRVNDNGSHRQNNQERNDDMVIAINHKLVDKSVFISDWVKQYYIKRGLISNNNCVIPNGVDRSIFYPNNKIRMKNEPLKLITHHWSSNMAKGYLVYDKIATFCNNNPEIATFRFLGNSPSNMLKNCDKIKPKPYKEIPKYLQEQDVYITATQFESGGCHIIEGMACGLIPLVRIGGGGPEEYSKGYGFYYNTAEELINIIKLLRKDYALYTNYKDKICSQYIYGAKDMSKLYEKELL